MESNDYFDDDEIVTLKDEEGNEIEFFVLAEFDYKDNMYICLQPVELKNGFDDEEIIFYQLVKNEDDGEDLAVINDEEVYKEVYEEFLKLVEEDN